MSLKFRLLLTTLVVPWLLMALLAAFILSLHHHQHTAQLEARLHQAAALLLPSLGEAASDGDDTRLEAVAARLLDLEEVRALRINDARGTALLELGRLRSYAAALPPPDTGTEAPRLERQDDQWRFSAPLPGSTPLALVLDIDAGPVLLERYRQLGITGLALALALLLSARCLVKVLVRKRGTLASSGTRMRLLIGVLVLGLVVISTMNRHRFLLYVKHLRRPTELAGVDKLIWMMCD